MLHPGLVSVTFRKFPPEQIVRWAAKAGMRGIEWGGDIHVPHGDVARAREVRRMTEDAGLQLPSYGSYYRVGHNEPAPFEAVLETAVALGAPVIRVWAGRKPSAEADEAYRRQVIEDSSRIGALAEAANVVVAYEFHRNTLSDGGPATKRLLQEVAHRNVRTYWQQGVTTPVEEGLAEIALVMPWLTHVHVTLSSPKDLGRDAQAEGAARWPRYLRAVAASGRDHFALLEFVRDDAPDNFFRDAALLLSWLRKE